MGLIVLAVIGSVTGWLGAILMRSENMQTVGQNVAVSVLAALVAGTLASSGSVAAGIGAAALVAAFLGSIVSLSALQALRNNVNI